MSKRNEMWTFEGEPLWKSFSEWAEEQPFTSRLGPWIMHWRQGHEYATREIDRLEKRVEHLKKIIAQQRSAIVILRIKSV